MKDTNSKNIFFLFLFIMTLTVICFLVPILDNSSTSVTTQLIYGD